MYKNILCPIDGSETSKESFRAALTLAKEQHAKLTIIHIIDTFYPFLDGLELASLSQIIESLRKHGKYILDEAMKSAKSESIEVKTHLSETITNKVADVIIAEAHKWHADIIVIGTHGRHGLNHLMLGSTAETVIRKSPIPVLTIRNKPN